MLGSSAISKWDKSLYVYNIRIHVFLFFFLILTALITAFMKILPVDVWTGLYSDNGSGSLKWVSTGLRYTYENFARGQPNLPFVSKHLREGHTCML